MLRFHLLGSPRVIQDDQEIHLSRRKSRALLYYLAAHTQALSREHLLAAFWPDLDRTAGQQVLRTTLYGLRKSLPEAVRTEDNRLELAPDVHVDVRAFTAGLSNPENLSALQTAIELYRGDFLADFSLPDTDSFEQWLTVEREQYRRMAVRGLTAISRLHEAGQEYGQALDALEKALSFDPLQEDLQRECIRLLYLSGDRARAIQRYDQLRRLLDEELGVPPMRETRRLYDDILNDRLETRPPPTPTARQKASPRSYTGTESQVLDLEAPLSPLMPFTGREVERRLLLDLAGGIHANPMPRLGLIEGEPGMGKSRLILELLKELDMLPVVGRAYELEHGLPYQPVIEALRGLMTRSEWPSLQEELSLAPIWEEEIARLAPELWLCQPSQPPAIAPSEARLWEGLRRFLLALADRKPVVFFLDDLHWADASTLALLSYLLHQPAAPILYLAAARPAQPRSPLAGLLATLIRSQRVVRVALPRLSSGDIENLARHLSPTYTYPLSEWLERNSEGNPFVMAELVRYANENQILQENGVINLSALSQSPVVPQTVYSLIQARLERLGGPARRVVEAAATLGKEFEFEVIYRAAGLSEEAALDALDELRASSMIVLQPGASGNRSTYRFDHSLTMEVAYREMSEEHHRLLHRRLAEALQTVNANNKDSTAGQIAYHYTQAGIPDLAASFALRAGQTASRLAAWKEAIHFFEIALAGERSPTRQREIALALGEAYLQGGEAARASEHYRTALNLSPAGSEAFIEAQLALAESLLPQARFGEAIRLAEQVRPPAPPEQVMKAEFIWGTALSLEGADLDEARAHLEEAGALCTTCSGPLPLAQIKFELGGVAAQQGDLTKAVRLYRESLTASREAGPEGVQQETLALNNIAYHLHLQRDPDARTYGLQGLTLAQEKGLIQNQTYLLSTLGEISLAEGDLETSSSYFTEGLALAERVSMPERIAGLTANLGLVARRRGQTEVAIHRLSTALAHADALGIRQLSAQVRLWLAPLLPPEERRARLAEARFIAESGGRLRLLEEARQIEQALNT